jgi:hypothetical protein
MSNHKESIQSIIDRHDEKHVKILKLNVLYNLIEKVEDKEDYELERQIVSIIKILNENTQLKGFYKKHYIKQHKALKSYVRKHFGYLAKGDLLTEHVALSTGAGVAIGAALVGINAGFIAIGVAVGVAIGVATGNSKEKAEQDKGNLY